jgi:dTDP-4-dehydrorhamnose reductase
MKILIIGSTGMLGNTLKEYLSSISVNYDTLNREKLDLSTCSYSELKENIISSKCDVLINCAGVIKQRIDSTTEKFISVNSLLPHRLSNICNDIGIKMIHITTDCVFSGKNGNYDENSNFDVNEIYGISKRMGEPNDCTVIRTSIIGEEINNKLSLLEWVKSNKNSSIDGYLNHIWNGLTALQLSKIMYNIISKELYWNGVRHIHSNTVSKYDLVNIINNVYELKIDINKTNGSTYINRSLSTIYKNDFTIPDIESQIIETKKFHNK